MPAKKTKRNLKIVQAVLTKPIGKVAMDFKISSPRIAQIWPETVGDLRKVHANIPAHATFHVKQLRQNADQVLAAVKTELAKL